MSKRLLLGIGTLVVLAIGFQAAAARPRQALGTGVITPDNAAQVVELVRFGQGSIRHMALSPDDRKLVVATTLGIWVHDTEALASEPTPLIQTPDVVVVAYSPDGRQLVTSDGQGVVTVWNADNGAPVAELAATAEVVTVSGVTFSPDGQTVAIAAVDGTVRLWQVALDEVQNLSGHTGAVNAVAYLPDAGGLVSVGDDVTVRLWDVTTGAETSKFTIPDETGLVSLAISPDGSRLFVGGEEKGIHVLDVTSGGVLGTLVDHVGQVNSLAISPDGNLLASGGIDQTIVVWDTATLTAQAQLLGHVDWMRGLAFSSDGRRLYSANWDNSVRQWDVASATQVQMAEGYLGRVVGVAFSPVEQLLVSGDVSVAALFNLGSSFVRLWDLDTLAEVYHLIKTDSLAKVFFGPKGDAIASSTNDGILRQWGVADGSEIGYGTGDLIGFNKDWSIALFRTYDSTVVQVMDLESGIDPKIQILAGHTDLVTAAAINPIDTLIATTSRDGSVRLWDAETGEPLAIYPLDGQGRSLAFSPNSSALAVGSSDGVITLWNVDTDEPLLRLTGHTGNVESVVYSPDGALLASAAGDGTLRLWDVSDGAELAVFHHTFGTVAQVVFNLDGTLLATGGDDGTVRVWGIP